VHLLLATMAAVLSATPEVAVVKVSTAGVSEATVALVIRTVTEGLQTEGLIAHQAARTCSDSRPCLASIATEVKAAAAVGVTVIRGRRDLTIDLEAVDPEQRELAVQTFSVPLSGAPFPPEAIAFFNTVSRRLKIANPPRDDAPREVRLTPETPIGGQVEVREVSGRTQATRVAIGVTIAGGVATLALVIAGVMAKGQLDQTLSRPGPIVGTRAQAETQASLANGLISGSLGAGGVTAAALTTALVLWATDDSAGP
jgi:hypothetical protein